MLMPDPDHQGFKPIIGMWDWVRATFMTPGAPLHNPDHEHLEDAALGFLWAGTANVKKLRRVIAQVEQMPPMGFGAWPRARAIQQLVDWFGEVPAYLVSIDAEWWTEASDRERCAVIEHELYHIAHEPDEFGIPKFDRDGQPKLTLRGHDVEEFAGVVERYGATSPELTRMAESIQRGGSLPGLNISAACGNCKG